MERKLFKNPVTDAYYEEKHFAIGECVYLNGFRFCVMDCDEYTHKYMEDNCEVFPQASIDAVLGKIKAGAYSYPSLQDYAIAMIKKLDANGDEVISFQEFKDGLRGMKIFLTDHEVNTMLRVFDHNGDGKISMEEFYNTLAAKIAS